MGCFRLRAKDGRLIKKLEKKIEFLTAEGGEGGGSRVEMDKLKEKNKELRSALEEEEDRTTALSSACLRVCLRDVCVCICRVQLCVSICLHASICVCVFLCCGPRVLCMCGVFRRGVLIPVCGMWYTAGKRRLQRDLDEQTELVSTLEKEVCG